MLKELTNRDNDATTESASCASSTHVPLLKFAQRLVAQAKCRVFGVLRGLSAKSQLIKGLGKQSNPDEIQIAARFRYHSWRRKLGLILPSTCHQCQPSSFSIRYGHVHQYQYE